MKKKLILAAGILGFLLLLSYLSSILILQNKLPLNVAMVLSRFYKIKAAEVVELKHTYPVYLADYLRHRNSLESFSKNFTSTEEVNINDLAWQGLVRDLWVNNLAKNFKLEVKDSEIEEYLQFTFSVEDSAKLAEFAKNDYNLSLKDFKNKVIGQYLLEMKVYQKLLENYNDKEGITKAQDAYAELEAGIDFVEVAQKYSSSPNSAETSIWVKESEWSDFYEPIKDLSVGDFSKIVITPGAYVIWRLENTLTDENNEKAWELKSIVIDAKLMDDFFQQYFTIIRINKFYQ